MKQAYRLLFLLLTVVFSFGFTTSESACQANLEVKHSCCQKPAKEEAPKKCKGDCCLQNITISRFEEGLVLSIDTQKTNLVSSKTSTENPFLVDCKLVDRLLFNKKFQLKSGPLKTPKFSSVKTQVWVI